MAHQPISKKKLEVVASKGEAGQAIVTKIMERQTDELIIAFCGPLGSGVSTVAEELSIILKDLNYEIKMIRISDLIQHNLSNVLDELMIDAFLQQHSIKPEDEILKMSRGKKIALLQSAGNELRYKYGNDILSQLAIKEIADQRLSIQEKTVEDAPQEPDKKTLIQRHPIRLATIIDSLKHPDEIQLLRTVYSNVFYLFGVLCPENIRKTRLEDNKKIKPSMAISLMDRDKSEEIEHGQQLLKTIQYSDFFISNIQGNITTLRPRLTRYVKLVFGDHSITPDIDEYGMYCAQSAALKSACIKRQVGAAIIDENSELIATGCNDVPKFGGALYSAADKGNDNRCMYRYGTGCKNREYINNIFNEIKSILDIKIHDDTISSDILGEIKNLDRLRSLLEFCRAVHAEMDAIISVARKGNVSLRNSVLYCTTFPCHNCARHIVAAGINKVIYIEPYEKSLALTLHEDSIKLDIDDKCSSSTRVTFIPFEGGCTKTILKHVQSS